MSRNYQDGKGVDAEFVLGAEIDNVAVMRDAVATISPALLPSAMFRFPLMRAALLPNHAVLRPWPHMPRTLRSMPNVRFGAWCYMPGSLPDMVRLRWPMLLYRVLFSLAWLFTFSVTFMLTVPISLFSAIAIRRHGGSEN